MNDMEKNNLLLPAWQLMDERADSLVRKILEEKIGDKLSLKKKIFQENFTKPDYRMIWGKNTENFLYFQTYGYFDDKYFGLGFDAHGLTQVKIASPFTVISNYIVINDPLVASFNERNGVYSGGVLHLDSKVKIKLTRLSSRELQERQGEIEALYKYARFLTLDHYARKNPKKLN